MIIFVQTPLIMKALEFKSKIKNNQILIPARMQAELNAKQNKNVRVIVLIDDLDTSDDLIFQQETQRQFIEGYSDSDSIYDNY